MPHAVNTPLVSLLPVHAPLPSLHDNTGDLDRLQRALAPQLDGVLAGIPLERMARVAAAFRAAGFQGWALVADLPAGPMLVDFYGRMPRQVPAMALDLGTTHLEACLIDLLTGGQMGRAQCLNPQIRHGEDILTRILVADQDNGLADLHRDLIGSINAMAQGLAGQGGVRAEAIVALCAAGNTAMTHFFLNLDPHHLCREPYIPLINVPGVCTARDLGLAIHHAAPVWTMPNVGSYFGGDLVAGILATGLDQSTEPCLLVDVGTNAEVVLGGSEWLIACAGAAGPALEGGVAQMGMRAGPGAIDSVVIDQRTGAASYTTVDKGPPQGLCGSGIIELVAGLYLAGIIDFRGKFRTRSKNPRLLRGKDGPAYIVAPAEEAAAGQAVLFGQADLDAVMRSKAAMYAILTTLTAQVGVPFSALGHFYVAGAFGGHISPQHAITLGMLPDLPLATYVSVGNSSLAGAQAMLLDRQTRERCADLVRKITYLELNVNQEFMLRFSGARAIPHTDCSLFPSVPCLRRG